MARAAAPDWPRMMRRATAAAYCDMAATEFEREVAAGRIPCPVNLGNGERWSRTQIDQALAAIAGEEATDWRAGSPLYAGG